MKKILRVFSSIFVLAIFCCIITGCSNNSYIEPETTIVKAIISDKEYIESYLDYGYHFDVWKGKYRWKFKLMPAEYNVTIQYNDLVKVYDSESLYESVEIGDSIDVELTTYFNSKGEIESQSISKID